MKTRTNLRAGDALRDCQRQRDYWKTQAERMEQIAKSNVVVNPPYYPPSTPTTPTTPTNPGYTGGWVNGVWYGDRSGWCG